MGQGVRLEVRRRYGESDVVFTKVENKQYELYCRDLGLNPQHGGCSPGERMAVAVCREIPDGAFLFAGTGLPLVGCMLAQHTYAPNAVIVMESGIVGPRIDHLPISVADPRAFQKCTVLSSMADVFGTVAMRGYCNVGVLGAAECDRYGNLNSTVIGGYESLGSNAGGGIRLSGSGGANPVASFADYVIVMIAHERRRFPEQCSYLTSPAGTRGRPGSGMSRRSFGLYRGKGVVVVSTMGVLRSDDDSGELLLDAVYQGADESDLYTKTGWPLKKSSMFHLMCPPTYEELKILRYVVDPTRVYLGRGELGVS